MISRAGIKVAVAARVLAFLKTLSPESRHRIRLAIADLKYEKGDIEALEGDMAGYHRLRIRSYRMIFRYDVSEGGKRKIFCPLVEHRSVVYVILENLLQDHSSGDV